MDEQHPMFAARDFVVQRCRGFFGFPLVPGVMYSYLFNEKNYGPNGYEYPVGYAQEDYYKEPIAAGGLGGLWGIVERSLQCECASHEYWRGR